jgi:AcrR family transcriptional regulator
MEVALGLFFEKGIYWTKIEDITEQADVGKGTFYQYFDTKEDLLAELLKHGLEQLMMRINEAARTAKPGPQLIRNIVEARLNFFVDNPEDLLLFHQLRGLLQLKTDASKELRELYGAHLDRLGQVVRPALNGAAKKGLSARDFAVALAAFTSGLLTYHLLFGEAANFKRRRTAITDQLEQSLRALI